MKVTVNVDAVGTSLDTLVEQYLTELSIPVCFGNMIPPILLRTIVIDDIELFKPRGSVSSDAVAIEHIEDCIVGAESKDRIRKSDLILTKEGEAEILEYKKGKAAKYVEQLVRCQSCDLIDICDRLTKNYLKFIEVEGQYKKGGVFK